MSTLAPTDDARPTPRVPRGRRQFWIAGLVLGLSLLGVSVAVAIAADKPTQRTDTQDQLQEQGGAKPHIIPLPDSGHEPTGPGDRGGWEQLLILGLIVGGLGVLGALIWRASRRSGSSRQAWLEAGRGGPAGSVPSASAPADLGRAGTDDAGPAPPDHTT